MKRTGTIAAFTLVTALAGCQDAGLEGNVPLEEAMNRPPSDLVAAVHAPAGTEDGQLVVDGRLWVPSGTPRSLDAAGLRAVGSASGRTVHARTWDRPPYDALFTPAADDTAGAATSAPDAWQEWAPVIGRSGALPGTGADHDSAGHAGAPADTHAEDADTATHDGADADPAGGH